MDIIGIFKNLENALDAASLRQEVISNNIANAGSPNFRTQAVAFEEEFKKAIIANNDKSHFDKGDYEIRAVTLDDSENENDNFEFDTGADPCKVRAKVHDTGMPVDMNKELANLAKNQHHYNMLSSKLGGFMGAIRMIIESTGK